MTTKERKLKKQKLRNNEYYGAQEMFDALFAKSQSEEVFRDLLHLIESENNILLAYRSIKKNKGSKTKGTNCVGYLKNRPLFIWLTIQFPATLFLLCLDLTTFLVLDWSVFHLDCLASFSLDKSIGINEPQQKNITLMAATPEITAAQIAESIGVTKRQIAWSISKLKPLGIISREGAWKMGIGLCPLHRTARRGNNTYA